MTDNISNIQAYYDRYTESDRLERHQLERDVTWRYLDKYLPSRGKILEIGAATGAYTIPLAKRGYSVTAVDLSPKLLDICQKRIAEEKLETKVICLVGDARDLSNVGCTQYDAVLMMGPLYNLIDKADRRKALDEAFERLKPGGKIFSAFISRYGIWGSQLINDPDSVVARPADLKSVIKKGKDTDRTLSKGGFPGYFSDVKDIAPLHKLAGFKMITLAGVEPAGVDDRLYNNLHGETRQKWLDLLFSISTEKSIIGASCHLLYIGEKI